MSTLLLRLAGPMQSWGTESKFDVRKTAKEPSKSGVIGLLASALGRQRDEPVDDLVQLRFGVRVDREGILQRDYHTAKAKGDKEGYVTNRYYLADAVFLVGVESDDDAFLIRLRDALLRPEHSLYLGRRSCPITLPLALGIRDGGLRQTLISEPLLIERPDSSSSVRCRLVMDDDGSGRGTGRVRDVPVSFDPANRTYGWRGIKIETITIVSSETEHDPMAELR